MYSVASVLDFVTKSEREQELNRGLGVAPPSPSHVRY